ncbi:MAG: D-alanine--D-alanine ligase [Desulfobulbaceae bacterium]|nr:D-alanine--D-alanine ligase [Desulfobulbaceae bacterium]
MQTQKLRIALVAGGVSGERQVSLNGAVGVEKSLNAEKFSVSRYDPATDLARLAADAPDIDFAFILLHGLYGEDGTMQGFLDLLKVPYQGSGVLGSAVAMDKNLAKELYRLHDLPVADWVIVEKGNTINSAELVERFGLPVVIKPVREGSSLGLTLAQSEEQMVDGIEKALVHDSIIMVEKYVKGRELTVGVLGNSELEPLPVIEIVPGEEFAFFDYDAKYKPGASEEICPAKISEAITRQVQEYAIIAHKALRLNGYSRTDMMLAEDESVYLLETNTIPGMTETSLMPQAAAAYGLPFPQFLERLIELGMEGRALK